MMDYYNQKFHYEILERLKKINVSADRINFLYDEKSKFLSQNQGTDAIQVVKMFDNLIEKERLLKEAEIFIEHSSNTNQKNNISESQKLHNQLNEIAYKMYEMKGIFEELDPKNKDEYDDLKDKFYFCFLDLYKQSIVDNYFWQFCPFEVYRYHYYSRFSEYRKDFSDISKEDYLLNEKKYIEGRIIRTGTCLHSFPDSKLSVKELKIKEDCIIYVFGSGFKQILIEYSLLHSTMFEKLEQTRNRIINFINEECNPKLGIVENEFNIPEIFLDYSNNSQTERIVFLQKLGILDYLQKKMIDELHGFSANKLAEIISTFTGIEQKTAQSYLNPMFTKDAIQKNNPLTKTNLEKVNNKMKDIGFNTLKSV